MQPTISRRLSVAAAALAVVVAACGSSDEPASPEADTTPTPAPDTPQIPDPTAPPPPTLGANFDAYKRFREAPTACGADRPDEVTPMTFTKPDDQLLDPDTPVVVTIETSCGDIVLELEPAQAPFAVNSFVFLARQGYYDGTLSHRIMSGFMFQAGDPTASGGGNPGYTLLIDEWPQEGFAYNKGVIAMANAGPQSTGSQFFIMLDSYPLPPVYTPLGRLVSGEEVLDAIAAIPVTERASGESSLPLEALYIERVTVQE